MSTFKVRKLWREQIQKKKIWKIKKKKNRNKDLFSGISQTEKKNPTGGSKNPQNWEKSQDLATLSSREILV